MITRGRVTQVSPLRVLLDNSDTEVGATRLDSYTPAVDDRVWLLAHKGSLLALGKEVA